jgi:hypothetical protein
MKRSLIVAAALGLLLPGVAAAQQPQTPEPPRPGERPAPQAPRPAAPRPPGRPAPPAPRPPAVRPPLAGRPMDRRGPPVYVRPLPPRGNQFWHRGQYYGRIQGPPFVYPRGYGYRRWAIGAVLPPLLFAPSYYYSGYAQLGLQAPPPGYAWVRYGPDLILVNIDNGDVEDVVYGAFL